MAAEVLYVPKLANGPCVNLRSRIYRRKQDWVGRPFKLHCRESRELWRRCCLSSYKLTLRSLPTVGLLDQILALDWVQQSIYLFGGESSQVTVPA
ncbi:putative carboxylesterase family protein [Diplocarpon rosae]|nr:putative carboxylesterase family protein [Diplocarpon rosae]